MIRCEHLAKNFRRYRKAPGILGSLKSFISRSMEDVPAVKEFSAVIEANEIVGLLGPNGAGKTTIMKMLSGIIAPSSGSASVLGFTPFDRSKQFRRQIALVMGQKSQLWWDIPAYDSFLLLQSYYEISDADFSRNVNELGELLGVSGLFRTHVRKLSLGERMKMELMACLLHSPRVLFLDEPTIGLDVVAQRNMRDFLRNYQRLHRTTILLTSHYMADVDALCDRIILLLDGQKRFDGTKEAFGRILGRKKFVCISFQSAVDPQHAVFQGLPAVWSSGNTEVELRIDEEQVRERTAAILSGLPVRDFATQTLPIERVMTELLSNPSLLPPAI